MAWNIFKHFIVIFYVLIAIKLSIVFASNNHKVVVVTEQSVEDAVFKWKIMEKNAQKGIESLLKRLIPYSTDSKLNLSSFCARDILEFIVNVKQLKSWAFKMFDASAKPSGGIFMGKSGFYGSYEECLDVVFPVDEFKEGIITRGQYCVMELQVPLPPKQGILYTDTNIFQEIKNATFETEVMEEIRRISPLLYYNNLRFGICIPSTCTKKDLLEMTSPVLSQELIPSVYSCEVKKPVSIDTVQRIIIGIFSLMVLVNVLAAIVDAIYPKNEPGITGKSIVLAFSPLRNFRKTMKTSQSSSIWSALGGAKVISMTWVVLNHTYLSIDAVLIDHLTRIEKAGRNDWLMQIVFNGFLNVDTFFTVTGILVTYNVIKTLDEKGFSLMFLPILFFKRFWRMMPSVMLMVAFVIIAPLLGSGPTWNIIETYAENCRERWWTLPLFISNFYNTSQMCLIHAWYISVDFQCFVCILIYLILLYKCPTFAKCFLVILLSIAILSTGIVTYALNLPPTPLMNTPDQEYLLWFLTIMYYSMYNHIGSYAIGAALGTYLARRSQINISRKLLVIGWVLSISTSLAVVYGVQPWNAGYKKPTRVEAIIYAALHKNAWSASIAWVFFVCAIGKGGLVNEFLSWRGFQPLSRLSYLVYLIHNFMSSAYGASKSGTIYAGHNVYIWMFFGNLVISFLVALVLKVLFEAPLGELERLLFAWLEKRKIEDVQNRQNDKNNFRMICKAKNGNGEVATNGFANGSFTYTKEEKHC